MEGNDVHTPESMTDAAPSETGHETEAIRGSMADASADATAREMKTDAEKPPSVCERVPSYAQGQVVQ